MPRKKKDLIPKIKEIKPISKLASPDPKKYPSAALEKKFTRALMGKK